LIRNRYLTRYIFYHHSILTTRDCSDYHERICKQSSVEVILRSVYLGKSTRWIYLGTTLLSILSESTTYYTLSSTPYSNWKSQWIGGLILLYALCRKLLNNEIIELIMSPLPLAVEITVRRSSSTPSSTMIFAIVVFLFLSAIKRRPTEAAIGWHHHSIR
jgi:hypothetical protein